MDNETPELTHLNVSLGCRQLEWSEAHKIWDHLHVNVAAFLIVGQNEIIHHAGNSLVGLKGEDVENRIS